MNPDAAIETDRIFFRYGKKTALDAVSVRIPARKLTGLIGPDGVGKSTLLALISGVRVMQQGELAVFGTGMRDRKLRNRICPRIAYMPQGLGKNLYFTLTVEENLRFFAGLFGLNAEEGRRRIEQLTRRTGLFPFLDRPAGKLSGGMKQKLGLCCSLIHDPDLLILDEPTTGVDPLARRQFWALISAIREGRPDLSVLTATAYMDEARRFEWLIAMDEGKILFCGSPEEMLERTGCSDPDQAFIRLLPASKRKGHRSVAIAPLTKRDERDYAIEASDLTRKFGSFTAVDHVSFRIRKGEIFGFLGSNGCGKTTTMRMLTGLLEPSGGTVRLFGREVRPSDLSMRRNLGYMTQQFSLYNELTVRQNLELSARLYGVPENEVSARAGVMLERFDLKGAADAVPADLPPGMKQRLSLAAAVIHRPGILILDEPTSGVDPVARDRFWELIAELSRRDQVTVFVTTHFMNEAERCDRVCLMHSGRSLVCDSPANLKAVHRTSSLETVFIRYLEEAESGGENAGQFPPPPEKSAAKECPLFDFRRFYSCFLREFLELKRDPVRIVLALFGGMILMTVLGYGLSVDVENIDFAVLDLDQSIQSVSYRNGIAGSRYFRERPALRTHAEADSRLKSGELALVIEIPPRFAADLQRGKNPAIAFWIDGSESARAETIRGYVSAMHDQWLRKYAAPDSPSAGGGITIQTRFMYNPEVKSLPAMVPSVMPVLMLMIPAILSALSVVREKELGSILNLYASPLRRSEFLLGKQLPYVILAWAGSILLILMAVFIFEVPMKGSLLLLLTAVMVYGVTSTGMGMLFSSVTRSQIAVIFLTMIGTVFPGVQLCGMITPIPEDGGIASWIGHIYPVTYMLLITRGVFNKGLAFAELTDPLLILMAESLAIAAIGILLQKKQEV